MKISLNFSRYWLYSFGLKLLSGKLYHFCRYRSIVVSFAVCCWFRFRCFGLRSKRDRKLESTRSRSFHKTRRIPELMWVGRFRLHSMKDHGQNVFQNCDSRSLHLQCCCALRETTLKRRFRIPNCKTADNRIPISKFQRKTLIGVFCYLIESIAPDDIIIFE